MTSRAAHEPGRARVVVGVDGSDGSRRAVEWARREAELRGAELEVVHAWMAPALGEAAGMPAFGVVMDALEHAAGDVLAKSVADAGIDTSKRGVSAVLRYGPAATVLLEAAQGADLLVVGSRGRGGFRGLLVGSVSQHCVQHAPCPVVVIPPDTR